MITEPVITEVLSMHWKNKVMSVTTEYVVAPTTNSYLELYHLTTLNRHDREMQKEKRSL